MRSGKKNKNKEKKKRKEGRADHFQQIEIALGKSRN
jgi:hypothetical protein